MLRLMSLTAQYTGLACLAVSTLAGMIALLYGSGMMFLAFCVLISVGLCSMVFSSVCEDHI